MFSTEEFIEASRKFVCVRLETYENLESEELVKRINGRLANTAFAILSPDGQEMLTPGGRSPSRALSDNGGKTDTTGSENEELIDKMVRIVDRYEPQASDSASELQDFHSLRQALNCASADQRLLVFVNAPYDSESVQQKLKTVFADEQVLGKFHLNFADPAVDAEWASVVEGAKDSPSIFVIQSGKFGIDGKVLEQVAIDSETDAIKATLLKANEQFATVEKRKDYESHVREGRRKRIHFENEIPLQGTDGNGGRSNRSRSKRRNRD